MRITPNLGSCDVRGAPVNAAEAGDDPRFLNPDSLQPKPVRAGPRRLVKCVLLAASALLVAERALIADSKVIDFKQQILPLLKESCFECHGAEKQKGKLRLDQRSAAFAGGRNGSIIVPGKATESEVYKRILLPKGDEDRMPNEGEPLAKEKIDLIRDWINQGAAWPGENKIVGAGAGTPGIKRGKTDLELSPADLLAPERPIPEVIDHYIDAKLKQAGVIATPQVGDAELMRRVMLDLAGRTPSREEAETYISSPDANKRAQLVERLLTTPWYKRHAATELNAMVRGPDATGPDQRGYFLAAMNENRSWDRIFRELLGEGSDPQGPEQFVTKRLNDPDLLTRDVSSIFFGINLSCCQCHTHPYVKTLTQDYFLGVKNFFSRCYEFQGTLREKQFGPSELEFKTKSGEAKKVGLKFLSGAVVEAPRPNVRDLSKAIQDENKRIEGFKKNFEKAKEFPPEPFFSSRREFVKTAELPENQILIARSIVNRLWSRYYGYGLVVRMDQMHSENPSSHPALLRWLSRDLIDHHWDLRRLIQGLVSSQAYSRSSRLEKGSAPGQELFAVANLRPLTPMQFGMSVLLLANSEFSSASTAKDSPAALEKKIESLESSAQTSFAGIIDRPGEGFQVDMDEPLGMSNDPERLKLIAAPLGAQLAKLTDRREQVDMTVWTVLGRPPTDTEIEVMGQYLNRHSTVAENERAERAAVANAERLRNERTQKRIAQIQAELASWRPSEPVLAANSAGWRYSTTQPVQGESWTQPDFDDSQWGLASALGSSVLGTESPKTDANSEPPSQDLVLRREFTLTRKELKPTAAFQLILPSPDGMTAWINGKRVDLSHSLEDHLDRSRRFELPNGTLIEGRNVVALRSTKPKAGSAGIFGLQLVPNDDAATQQQAALNSELSEARKLASTPIVSIPSDITSRNALEQLVWGLVSGAEFRFNH